MPQGPQGDLAEAEGEGKKRRGGRAEEKRRRQFHSPARLGMLSVGKQFLLVPLFTVPSMMVGQRENG